MENSKQSLCDECGVLLSNNQNRLRHVREVHQGMKRRDKKKADPLDKILLNPADIGFKEEKMKSSDAICFRFVRDKPWTEDMKRKAEESFEELFRACNQTFIFVEYESREDNVTDEGRLVVTDKLVSQMIEL